MQGRGTRHGRGFGFGLRLGVVATTAHTPARAPSANDNRVTSAGEQRTQQERRERQQGNNATTPVRVRVAVGGLCAFHTRHLAVVLDLLRHSVACKDESQIGDEHGRELAAVGSKDAGRDSRTGAGRRNGNAGAETQYRRRQAHCKESAGAREAGQDPPSTSRRSKMVGENRRVATPTKSWKRCAVSSTFAICTANSSAFMWSCGRIART